MPTDNSLQCLREAAPRHQPGFEEWTARFGALGEQISAVPVPARRLTTTTRRRLISLSAAAAAVVALVAVAVGVIPNPASPPSAYAAASQALAATVSARSGTMTQTVTHDGTSYALGTTTWHGHNIGLSSGPRHQLGPDRQLLLTPNGVYVQRANRTWLHYPSASDVAPKLGPAVRLAEDNVTGSTVHQILGLATGIRRTKLPDGGTRYTGTIPSSSADPGLKSSDDAILRMITSLRSGNEPGAPRGSHSDLELRLTAGADGHLQQVSLVFQQHGSGSRAGDGTYTWSVTYHRLGTTPQVTIPATSAPAK